VDSRMNEHIGRRLEQTAAESSRVS